MLRKVATLSSLKEIHNKGIYYQHYIESAGILMKIFGLFQDGDSDISTKKEIRTVLDMREHGYSFDFVKRSEVINGVMKIVNSEKYRNQSLTLLWDDQRVIEFTSSEVKISE